MFTGTLPLKGDKKAGTNADFASGRNASPMFIDDALDAGKADAGSRIFILPNQSLEGKEQLLSVLRFKSDTLIFDDERHFWIGWIGTN